MGEKSLSETKILLEILSDWTKQLKICRAAAEEEFNNGESGEGSFSAAVWLARRFALGGPDELLERSRREIALIRTFRSLAPDTAKEFFSQLETEDTEHASEIASELEAIREHGESFGLSRQESDLISGIMGPWISAAASGEAGVQDGMDSEKGTAGWLANRMASGGVNEIYHQAHRHIDLVRLIRHLGTEHLRKYFAAQTAIDLQRAGVLIQWLSGMAEGDAG